MDESSLSETSGLPSWDRLRIKAFRDAQTRVSEMERALEERTNEETELTTRANEYSIDSTLLAQADEIEQLLALTGNYASQARDLPRVRIKSAGMGKSSPASPAGWGSRTRIACPPCSRRTAWSHGFENSPRPAASSFRISKKKVEPSRAYKRNWTSLNQSKSRKTHKPTPLSIAKHLRHIRPTFSRLPETPAP